jgi:hypothetical protein
VREWGNYFLLSRAQSGGNFVAMEEVWKQQTKKKTKNVRKYKGAKEFVWGVGVYRQPGI